MGIQTVQDISNPYIYISYAHKDKARVSEIIQELSLKGYRFWYDEGLEIGNSWIDQLVYHMDNCSGCLFFVSEEGMKSAFCMDEFYYVRDCGKTIIPIFLDDKKLPVGAQLLLGNLQGIWAPSLSAKEIVKEIEKIPALDDCREDRKKKVLSWYRKAADSGQNLIKHFSNAYDQKEEKSDKNDSGTDRRYDYEKEICGMQEDILQYLLQIQIGPIVLEEIPDAGDWFEALYFYMKNEIKKGNNISKFQDFVILVEDNGIQNISFADIDVTLAQSLLLYCFEGTELGYKSNYQTLVRHIVQDRNSIKHTTQASRVKDKDAFVLKEIKALVHIDDFIHYLRSTMFDNALIWEKIPENVQKVFLKIKKEANDLSLSIVSNR